MQYKGSTFYPITITESRYGGTYEPGNWLAWNLEADKLPRGWNADDTVCKSFWQNYKGYYGAGDTPKEALFDLLGKIKK